MQQLAIGNERLHVNKAAMATEILEGGAAARLAALAHGPDALQFQFLVHNSSTEHISLHDIIENSVVQKLRSVTHWCVLSYRTVKGDAAVVVVAKRKGGRARPDNCHLSFARVLHRATGWPLLPQRTWLAAGTNASIRLHTTLEQVSFNDAVRSALNHAKANARNGAVTTTSDRAPLPPRAHSASTMIPKEQ